MALSTSRKLPSITAVVIVRALRVELELLRRLSTALQDLFVDVEIILVANGVTQEMSLTLKQATGHVPDCTVVFLSEEVHDDLARLLGIDHAISDYITFATPLQSEIDALPSMVAALQIGNDLVVGEGGGDFGVQRDWFGFLAYSMFRRVYRMLTGNIYEAQPPRFRLLSRAAALFIATRPDGEVLVRARELGPGFPSTTVPIKSYSPIMGAGMPARMAAGKGLRLLLTGSALPLRISSYFGFLTGSASILYAGYVLLTYLFRHDVAQGWTTLSLQSAGIMFLLSIQFLFLSEYLVQILSSSPLATRRQLVAREIRGAISSRSGRLNVVDTEGQFQVGAPPHLIVSEVQG